MVANVSYKLSLALIEGGESFHGHMIANFTLNEIPKDLFLDFKGRKVRNVVVNGKSVKYSDSVFVGHRVHLPSNLLQLSKNTVSLDFEAEYVTDCQGMQWFKDEEDSLEYVYTNSEPDHGHLWFPCFD